MTDSTAPDTLISGEGPTAAAGNAASGYARLVDNNDDGTKTIRYRVTGAHCGACIQVIESGALAVEGVDSARLNFSTERLVVGFRGNDQRANEIAGAVAQLGYGVSPDLAASSSQKSEMRRMLASLGVSGFAMGNIMLLSLGLWASTAESMGFATRAFMHWVSAVIAVPAVLYAGQPFFRSALSVLRAGRTNMDVPISLALILATGISVHELLTGGDHVFFDSAVMLMFFLLIGRTLDLKARQNARRSAADLMDSLKGFATLVEDGEVRQIPYRDVRPGMVLRVAKGEKISADGMIARGESTINAALVTGESVPVDAREGDRVFAGTINLGDAIDVRAEKADSESLLSEIVRLIEAAEDTKSRYQALADRAAQLYTPVVHSFALIALAIWWGILGVPFADALMVAVTVLIITCPCALGLAVPVVQVLATSGLMRRGVMVKSGDALERLALVDTALLDKTGTLTLGAPKLAGSVPGDVLKAAASLAVNSKHPLAQSLADQVDGPLYEVREVEEYPGRGLVGEVLIDDAWRGIRVGNRLLTEITEEEASAATHLGPEVWVRIADGPAWLCEFNDPLRDDAAEVIDDLRGLGIAPSLVSGDRKQTVAHVAKAIGIDALGAALSPKEKYTLIECMKDQGRSTLMIGDGLNDTPTLAAAHVSMAPVSAIDMAQAQADIVYQGDKLAPVTLAVRVARLTRRLIKQNFALAVAYNIIAVPLAFMGLVTPVMAAIAMSASSLLVIANSYRLRRLV